MAAASSEEYNLTVAALVATLAIVAFVTGQHVTAALFVLAETVASAGWMLSFREWLRVSRSIDAEALPGRS